MSPKQCIRLAVILVSAPALPLAAQTSRPLAIKGKQWRVEQGRIIVGAHEVVYSYEPTKQLMISMPIPLENITELDFSSAASRHHLDTQTVWPDWGTAIRFVGPVVDNVDLSKSKADLIAIQFTDNNEIKALVLEVPREEYASLSAELSRALEHKFDPVALRSAK